MNSLFSGAGLVFSLSICATFAVTLLARHHSKKIPEGALAAQNLNKWLLGLSAGATANSGFIVTAAVGLGYLYGAQWLLLPIAWLMGDIIFWSIFPGKINDFGKRMAAKTITDLISGGRCGAVAQVTTILVGLIVVACLMGYTAAQWLAGQKFVTGAFGIDPIGSLALFAVVIIAYTAIGGFRGSIYADSLQAVVRIIGTLVAVGAVISVASNSPDRFFHNIQQAGPGFLDIFGLGGPATIFGFVLGFAAAALGFGLGQPQIITRYLAGRDAKETQAAWWIYLGFVQFTWIAMTLFGLVLRGIEPALDDPETGLSVFFTSNFGSILSGIIISDIFATIAATSNSLLVAMAQTTKNDLLPRGLRNSDSVPLGIVTVALGIISMAVSLNMGGTVLSLALSSVSLMGAGLAPAVAIRVLHLRHNGFSVLLAICGGLVVAIGWKLSGLSAHINESAPGILAGLTVNFFASHFARPQDKISNQRL